MAQRQPPLGSCPDCGETIPRSELVLRYQGADWPATLATCPACDELVNPA